VAFGTLLRRYRVAAGLTQEELAARAGISQRNLGDLERGVGHSPRKDTIALLAGALALSPQERAALTAAARRIGAATPRDSAVGTGVLATVPFVGRRRELTLLEQHLRGEGPPLLLLAGEPGIGKTRLLHAALPRAVTVGLQVLQGGCQRRGGQDPYAPLVGSLQRYLRGRGPRQLRAELQGCAWLVRLLPELAAGPIPPLPKWTLTPEQEQRLMGEAVVRVLTNVAGPSGTLLLLDDLQWAGPDAIDLLALLVRSAMEVPLRIIGTYRDTEVQPHDPLSGLLADLAHAGLAARRLLAPLAPEEVAQLLDELLVRDAADAESTLRGQILRRTGGVPFFVVSCALDIQRAGQDGAAREAVPWDVGQSIRHRVAALPEVARELAGAAAVVGRVVPRALLAHILERPEEDVVAALEALCHARVLEDQGEDTYQFAHDVIREVVEAGLSTARRTLLHRRIAQSLERQQGELPVEALAYHYAAARERTAAAHWLERAGDHAAAGFANAAALEHYAAARDQLQALTTDVAGVSRLDEKLGDIRLLAGDLLRAQADFARARHAETQPARRALLWYKEAQTYRWRNDFPRALAAFAAVEAVAAEEAAKHAVPRSLLADVASIRGEIYVWQSQYDAAACDAERALALLAGENAGKMTDLARSSAMFVQGQVAAVRGAHVQADELYRGALAIQDHYGDQEQVHRTLLYMGSLALDRGRFAGAEQCWRRGLAIGEQIGNPRQAAVCWQGLAELAHLRGNLDLAEDCAQKGRALSEPVGHQASIGSAWLNLGQVALLRGALIEAEACFQRAHVIAAATQRSPAISTMELGLVARQRGDLVIAAAMFRAARRRGKQDGAARVEAAATIAQASVRLRQGRVRAAALLLARGRALADRDGWAQPAMQAALLQVELLLCQKEHDLALMAAEAALRRALAEGRRYDEALARRLLGQCILAQGDHALAENHLRAALALQTEIGAALEAARTRVVLATSLGRKAERETLAEEADALLAAARSQFIASGARLDLARAAQLAATWPGGA
jgi:transcriptional regulator with XRE-family HTH domain/tetratricopeptide (TPR) repeat protein